MAMFVQVAPGVPNIRRDLGSLFEAAAAPHPNSHWPPELENAYTAAMASRKMPIELEDRPFAPDHCAMFDLLGWRVELTLEISVLKAPPRNPVAEFEPIGFVKFFRGKDPAPFFYFILDGRGHATGQPLAASDWFDVHNRQSATSLFLAVLEAFVKTLPVVSP
jgi:hypothetical protein